MAKYCLSTAAVVLLFLLLISCVFDGIYAFWSFFTENTSHILWMSKWIGYAYYITMGHNCSYICTIRKAKTPNMFCACECDEMKTLKPHQWMKDSMPQCYCCCVTTCESQQPLSWGLTCIIKENSDGHVTYDVARLISCLVNVLYRKWCLR